jgi:AcrR family transcriptional regulator
MSTQRDTAAAIIREAKTIIDERGESALRVTELAERCGISPSVLYHHYRDRDDIVAAVRVAEFAARVEADSAQIGDLALSPSNLADILSVLVDDMADPRNEQRRQFRHERMQALIAARLDPDLQERLTHTQSQLSEVIRGAVRTSQEAGLLDTSLDDKAMAFLFEVIPLGTALATVYGDHLPSPEAWHDVMMRVITSLMPRQ